MIETIEREKFRVRLVGDITFLRRITARRGVRESFQSCKCRADDLERGSQPLKGNKNMPGAYRAADPKF